MTTMQSIAENVAQVRDRIARAAARVGRRPESVTLMAVSKTVEPERIRQAAGAGIQVFGENRVQEFAEKFLEPGSRIAAEWHLIGHLQSNKARRAAHLFDRADSVNSLALAQKLDSAAADEGKRLPILIEVRSGEEATKHGIAEFDVLPLAEAVVALPHLDLQGLMTIPPFFPDSERLRPYFRNLRELRGRLSSSLNRPLPVLSMGMSHDFEVAIEEGSTEIRVGTALFGERNAHL
jgi:PLP dependent protein